MQPKPIFYSFRRCPYAMRTRMVLRGCGVDVEHREILLKNKPPQMLDVSPKGTVPVLVQTDGSVLDESMDIIYWALQNHDPNNWLGENACFLDAANDLIRRNDKEFKPWLDRYKYADRYPENSQTHYRNQGMVFIKQLNHKLAQTKYLLSNSVTVADLAIFPFVRQFAFVDKPWFDANDCPHTQAWLSELLVMPLFEQIMEKQPPWEWKQRNQPPSSL